MFKLVGLLLLLLSVKVASSQPDDPALTALRLRTVGHRFILRDFSAQEVTRYHYQDAHLQQDAPPLMQSAAVFQVKDVSLQGTLLTLRGQRSVVVEDKVSSQISTLPQMADASILVDLGTADEVTVLSRLIDDLFFPTVPSALAAVPPYLRSMVPYRINLQSKQPCKDCTHWIRRGTWQELPVTDSGLQNPQLIRGESGAEPPISDKTVTHATASFAFVVDEKGNTSELWLNLPAGHGLDEFWTNVLRKQVFWPAKYRGTAVAVPLGEDHNYQHF